MSLPQLMSIAFLGDATAPRKSLLYSLAICCDLNGQFEYDWSTVAAMSGLKERALRSHFKTLVSSGHVQPIDEGRNLYRLAL